MEDCYKDRTVVGLVEDVVIKGSEGEEHVRARIDSGATRSSIDIGLTSKLRLGPVIASKVIKSANGARLRPLLDVTINLHGRSITETFTLADRSSMKYKVLVGQDILKQGFLIDPNKEV